MIQMFGAPDVPCESQINRTLSIRLSYIEIHMELGLKFTGGHSSQARWGNSIECTQLNAFVADPIDPSREVPKLSLGHNSRSNKLDHLEE